MKRSDRYGWSTLLIGLATVVLGGVVMAAFDGEIVVAGFLLMMIGCGFLGTGASILVHPEDWE